MLQQAAELNGTGDTAEPRLKRCVQCFQDRERAAFSKRQLQSADGKCRTCVTALESVATGGAKWSFDSFYRSCHRGKTGGVAVRTKDNIAAPVLGFVPLGRVFRGTQAVANEQGDRMVKLASLACVDGVSPENRARARDGWVPCRSIRNEVLVEPHAGPFAAPRSSKFFRCVIEGCKARVAPDLALAEIGYVLYGDVVEVVEAQVAPDGVVFLRLHARYFDGAAWVVERTLDNESVLNEVEGPSAEPARYRCVQETGAPTRLEPSLSSPPTGRIPCGTVVTAVERVVNPQRQVFLRLEPTAATATERRRGGGRVGAASRARTGSKSKATNSLNEANEGDEGDRRDRSQPTTPPSDLWVIETSTCCASVLLKLPSL
ncbi:hypothetical protein PybrP1_007273 [[Pythium] brassicae (nom. inval.)]|nr:hypothetical protein PybrP1_007273 [[Pythium] brassicae (nom. inval.)]